MIKILCYRDVIQGLTTSSPILTIFSRWNANNLNIDRTGDKIKTIYVFGLTARKYKKQEIQGTNEVIINPCVEFV